MKKIFNILIIISIITFSSCQKEMIEQKTQNTSQKDNTEFKIKRFKTNIQNFQTKENSTISIDSAVWYIEAALNYSYCILTTEQSKIVMIQQISDSLIINFNSNNETTTISEVGSIYSTVSEQLENILSKLNYCHKKYNIIDVEIIDKKMIIRYLIRYIEQENKSNTPIGNEFYNITGNWYWGYAIGSYPWRAGRCDGTEIGKDACSEMEIWVNTRRAVYTNVYYTDIHFVGLFNSARQGNPNGTNLSIYGIDLFSHIYSDIPYLANAWFLATYLCFNSQKITYYAQQYLNALNVLENNFLNSNEDIVESLILGYEYYRHNPETCELYYMFWAKAGIRHHSNEFEY